VIVFGVVAGVGQQAVEGDVAGRLPHRLRELGRIVAGAARGHRPCQEVRGIVADYRQLGPGSAAFKTPTAAQVIQAGLVRLEARGVDRGFRACPDQAEGLRSGKNSGQERLESPFFSSRCCA
jgi:hypothetical protein